MLTKLDIMDKGTDASAMLRNQIVPLRLGYIGMVNRSQMDINLKRSIRDAGAAEAAFFESHSEYQEVSSSTSSLFFRQKILQNAAEAAAASLQKLAPSVNSLNRILLVVAALPDDSSNALSELSA